mmetsp:Transcript_39538/g.123148  ORF Transcript_39538/g.123148 Transcript_39538/m.123148 type:complete len:342 (+) Transcript_39538:189-1214(+)
MKTVFFGGDIRGSSSSSAVFSFSAAGAMSGVWKAPEVFKTLACRAPALSALSFRAMIARSVPAAEKPRGNSSFAIMQTAEGPSSCTACLQSFSRSSFGIPATEIMCCLPTAAASCMASPRRCTSRSPSSKLKTPAAQSAVYSPKDRPAVAMNLAACCGLSRLIASSPARHATYIAGWQYLVSSSFASGPVRQRVSTSQPRISFALSSIALTSGMSQMVLSIFTYCEPWPGKRSAIGNGSLGDLEGAELILTVAALPLGPWTETQPVLGPDPLRRLKHNRPSLSTSSSMYAPVDRCSASSCEPASSLSCTQMPSHSPPTTSQSCLGPAPPAASAARKSASRV